MSGFKLPNSIFNKIAALPEFNVVPLNNEDQRRYLDTILSLALTKENWNRCAEYGLMPKDVFRFFDVWERAGLFSAIPVALTSVRSDSCKWLKLLPEFTTSMRGRYYRQISRPKNDKSLVIDLVLGKTYCHVGN